MAPWAMWGMYASAEAGVEAEPGETDGTGVGELIRDMSWLVWNTCNCSDRACTPGPKLVIACSTVANCPGQPEHDEKFPPSLGPLWSDCTLKIDQVDLQMRKEPGRRTRYKTL